MRTERTDILIKRTDSVPLSEVCIQGEERGKPVHFHVLQSLKHNKWVLAAVKGTISAGLEPRQIEMLNQLKIKYME